MPPVSQRPCLGIGPYRVSAGTTSAETQTPEARGVSVTPRKSADSAAPPPPQVSEHQWIQMPGYDAKAERMKDDMEWTPADQALHLQTWKPMQMSVATMLQNQEGVFNKVRAAGWR